MILCCCGFLQAAVSHGETAICDFEYANDQELRAAWSPTLATLRASSQIRPGSQGTKCLLAERVFSTNVNEIEVLSGPLLAVPVSLGTNEVIEFYLLSDLGAYRSKGNLTIFAQDTAGNVCSWEKDLWSAPNWLLVQLPCGSALSVGERPNLQQLARFSFRISFKTRTDPGEFIGQFGFDDMRITAGAKRPAPPGGLVVNPVVSGTR